MNTVLETIKSRRSIRGYSTAQLSQETLDFIIEAGIYAPTTNNEQPWHFTVIQNPAVLEHINVRTKELMLESDIDWAKKMGSNAHFRVTYNAPTLIIVSGRKDSTAWNVDCSAAIENMLIASESLGVGSVWLGLLRFLLQDENEVNALGIPDEYQPFYGVSFGYSSLNKKPVAPKRNMDVVNYIR